MKQLLEIESGFWRTAGDGSFYDEHMADDGFCVFGIGIMDKEATQAGASASDPWDSFEPLDARVLRLGDDVAVLSYRADAKRGGDAYAAFVTSVYRRLEGRWQLVVHQQTERQERQHEG